MIPIELENATATLYEVVEVEREDSHGDTVTTTEFQESIEDVPARYEPQGSSFIQSATGDKVTRQERVFVPLEHEEIIEEGSPIDVTHYGRTYKWRVDSNRIRSLDGHSGFCELDLADFGD